MFDVKKYETSSGKCPFDEFIKGILNNNKTKSVAKIFHFCNMLSEYGFEINERFNPRATKLIDNKNRIYELRPDSNRILYFFDDDGRYILLHGFIKKTNKTPKTEIEKAIKEKKDYERRKR